MRRRITGVVAVLLVSSAFLWAADVSELRTAFTDAIANGDAAQAIENYNDMVDQANKDYKKAQRSYEKALEAGNMLKAREARADMYNASYSAMTKDETDSLLSLILSGIFLADLAVSLKTALDLSDGTEVKLSRFEQDARFREGDAVQIFWDPDKSVAIKKAQA